MKHIHARHREPHTSALQKIDAAHRLRRQTGQKSPHDIRLAQAVGIKKP